MNISTRTRGKGRYGPFKVGHLYFTFPGCMSPTGFPRPPKGSGLLSRLAVVEGPVTDP